MASVVPTSASPVAGTYISGLAPPHLRGRYMGLWSATWSIGMMFGPPLGALLFAKSPGLLWSLCGVLGALSALLVVLAMDAPAAARGVSITAP